MAQKNLLKVPQQIIDRIRTFELDDVVAACAKRLKRDEIARYVHLGLRLEGGQLVVPEPAVPPPTAGRYSNANVNGKEVVRRDLPMTTKTYSWDTPNWGDWSNGSHTQYVTRDVYQRDFIPPKEVELSITLVEQTEDGSEFTIKFAVNQVINRRASDFEAELLYNLTCLIRDGADFWLADVA
jgi:hypothetical protein